MAVACWPAVFLYFCIMTWTILEIISKPFFGCNYGTSISSLVCIYDIPCRLILRCYKERKKFLKEYHSSRWNISIFYNSLVWIWLRLFLRYIVENYSKYCKYEIFISINTFKLQHWYKWIYSFQKAWKIIIYFYIFVYVWAFQVSH